MKKYIRLGIGSAAAGVTIGFLFSLAFSFLFGATQYYPSSPRFVARFQTPLQATAVSALLWVLIGLVFGYGTLIFEIEEWSLLRRTVVTCLVYYVGFLPLAIAAGWFPLDWKWIAVFTGIYLLIYAIIWAINYWVAEAQVRRINQGLSERSGISDDGDADGTSSDGTVSRDSAI
jgi:hypothetical protein